MFENDKNKKHNGQCWWRPVIITLFLSLLYQHFQRHKKTLVATNLRVDGGVGEDVEESSVGFECVPSPKIGSLVIRIEIRSDHRPDSRIHPHFWDKHSNNMALKVFV